MQSQCRYKHNNRYMYFKEDQKIDLKGRIQSVGRRSDPPALYFNNNFDSGFKRPRNHIIVFEF